MLEIIQAFLQSTFSGWNLPVALTIVTGIVVATPLATKAIIKSMHGSLKAYYRHKINKVEDKIREYSNDKDRSNIFKLLEKREKYRIKAAKKGYSLSNDSTLDNLTYNQKKLSKFDKTYIIRDAELNKLLIKGDNVKFTKKAKKWQMTGKKDFNAFNEKTDLYQASETITFKNQKIKLSSNSVASKFKTIVNDYEIDLNKDTKETEFPSRKKSAYPLVLEIMDKNGNPVFSLNDNSGVRFYKYTIEAFAHLNNLMEDNISKSVGEEESYRIVFYDTAKEKNVKHIDTLINNPAALHNFAVNFDWNFGQVKPLPNYGRTEDFSRKIKERSDILKYQETRVKLEGQKNSFEFANEFSQNLKSKSLEKGFNSIILDNSYSKYDVDPYITTFTVDGKPAFEARVESRDLFKSTDAVVEAYIVALMIKRLENGQSNETLQKTVQFYELKTEIVNGVEVVKKNFVKYKVPLDIPTIFEKNKKDKNFFAAFLAVAMDFELKSTVAYLNALGIEISKEETNLYNKYMKKFQENKTEDSLKRFGILGDDRKEVKYSSVEENPEDFEKATHYTQAKNSKKPKQTITTTLKPLKVKFYNEVKEETNFDKFPHTVDIVCEDDKATDIFFKLGVTVYDDEKFKEYYYDLLLEALYLVEGREMLGSKTPINLYVSFVSNDQKPFKRGYKNSFELRDQIEKYRKQNKIEKGINEFKKEFDISDSGKGL